MLERNEMVGAYDDLGIDGLVSGRIGGFVLAGGHNAIVVPGLPRYESRDTRLNDSWTQSSDLEPLPVLNIDEVRERMEKILRDNRSGRQED